MRRMLLASAAMIAAIGLPTAAVNAQVDSSVVTTADGQTFTLDESQQATFNAWTADQRASYEGWPYEIQGYYWSLTPEQAAYWWTLTDEQRVMLYGYPEEQRVSFYSWPEDYRTYYWTLPSEQQDGYWALTDDQRGMIYKMTPDQRAKAWSSVLAQLNGETPATPPGQANPPGEGMPTTGVPNPDDASDAVPPAMPADESYQGGPYKGALTPPPASAMNKDYPVCTRKIQDSCRNPGGK